MTSFRTWSPRSSQRSLWISFVMLLPVACTGVDEGQLDFDFDIPRTEPFPQNLSSYGIYQSDMASLAPAEGVHLYEMSSILFTDYAKKQRLVKVVAGHMNKQAAGPLALRLNDRPFPQPVGLG